MSVELRIRIDYRDREEGWFWSEDFSIWRGCELKRKEGKVLLPLGKLLDDVIWRLTYGNLEDRNPALARKLKRAERLRLKFGRVTCERRRGWLKKGKSK